uniref:Reverse transcriptase domain-containing protein n=1 Tax=Homalodisca liturata TaxID=320908 RepID=A0A1B6J5A1_9HEMI
MDYACPVKRTRHKKSKKLKTFIDEESLGLKATYLKCLDKHRLTGSTEDKAAASKAKKDYDLHLKMLRQQASAEYINNAENKSKAAWQVINSQRNKGVQKPTKLKMEIDGKETNNPNEIAEHLNKFFTNVADTTLAINNQYNKSTNTIHHKQINHYLTHLKPTDIKEIHEILKSFKPKTSAGVDGISSKLVKQCSNSLSPPLVYITNMSLRTGQFPLSLKLAKIYPKLKSGSPMDPSNYRPISLIPTFSKVIEQVVLRRLLNHCEQEKLLSASQHGFLKGRSTTTAIIELVEFIIDHLESGQLVTSIMLDFSKAFDCLGHNLIF